MDQHNDSFYPFSNLISVSGDNINTFYTQNSKLNVILPERSKWRCELFGCGESLILHPTEGEEPNFFWRWMQYICFGNKWKKE